MQEAVRRLFDRYQDVLARSLSGEVDADGIASLYATDFIAASPAGVVSGKNHRVPSGDGAGIRT